MKKHAYYGKCTNRANCTLSYTGDQVRFEGKPICPECGKALVIDNPALSSTSGREFWVLVGIVFAMALVGVYLWSQSSAKQQQTVLVATTTPAPTPTHRPPRT